MKDVADQDKDGDQDTRAGMRPGFRRRLCGRFATPALAGIALGMAAGCTGRREAAPDGVEVRVQIAPAEVSVGTPATVTVRTAHPADARVELPPRGTAPIEVQAQTRAVREGTPGWAVTEHTWRMLSFEVGEHALFEETGRVIHADGTEETLPLTGAVLRVVSTLADGNEQTPRDFKPLLRWPGRVPPWLWAPALIAAVAALLGILARGMRRRARRPRAMPPPPLPHLAALAALRRLLERGWIERGQAEPFYVELSAIVRRYLEGRFGLHAPERTTEELIEEASTSQRLSPEQQARVRDFLATCDLVKFARHAPAPEDMRTAWDAAERLVRESASAGEEPG